MGGGETASWSGQNRKDFLRRDDSATNKDFHRILKTRRHTENRIVCTPHIP